MISKRQFDVIAMVDGLAAAEACADGDCAHTAHQPPHSGQPLVDLRCPASMGKLLGRTRPAALPGGVVELACNNCTRAYRAAGVDAARVLHRFNLLGEPLSTEIALT